MPSVKSQGWRSPKTRRRKLVNHLKEGLSDLVVKGYECGGRKVNRLKSFSKFRPRDEDL